MKKNRRKIKVSPYRDVKYYKCPYCNFATASFREMTEHLHFVHNGEEQYFFEIIRKSDKIEVKKIIVGGIIC